MEQIQNMDQEIISFLDTEIENIWNGLVGNWVSLNFHEKSDIIHGKNLYFGAETVSLTKELSSDSDEIADFLIAVFL